MKYRVINRKVPQKDGSRKEMQVATQVNHGRIDIGSLSREIADLTSLGRGDVRSVLLTLSDVAQRYISLGFSVHLGELGTLSPRISAKAIPVGEKYTADHIKTVRARYTPGVEFKSMLRSAPLEYAPDDDKKCKAPDPGTPPAGGTTHGDEPESGDL